MSALDTYKALADESRLRLVNLLSRGNLNVQELTSIMNLSQPTVSHHLKVLTAANLVRLRREGTWGFYSLIPQEENKFGRQTIELFLGGLNNGAAPANKDQFRADEHQAEEVISKRRDEARKFFDSVAPKWKELRAQAQGPESYLEEIIAQIPAGARLLELGCGSGALLERILPRTGQTIGVDYSQSMLNAARENLGDKASGADLRLGYLEHIPVENAGVDVAVAHMVFHHLPRPEEALKDAARVLAPGGKLLVVDLVEHKDEYMRERFADLWLGFSTQEFSAWAKAAGFEQIETSFLGPTKAAFILSAKKAVQFC